MLSTSTVDVWDVICPGHIEHPADEESAATTHLVFPYRGVYVHHVGRKGFVAEANQVLFLNENEPYRVSHPLAGGDSTMSVSVKPETLLELTPAPYRHPSGRAAFDRSGVRVGARTQRLAATLRQRLRRNTVEALEAEETTLELI